MKHANARANQSKPSANKPFCHCSQLMRLPIGFGYKLNRLLEKY